MKETIDARRRHVLRAMGVMGAGALAAGLPVGAFAADQKAALGVDALSQSLARVSLPKHSIDVHTHFFNASDAAVVGYLTHSMLHDSPRLQQFAEKMKGVLLSLISTAPSAQIELRFLELLYARKLETPAMEAVLDMEENQQRRQIARQIAVKMRENDVAREFGAGISTNKGFQSLPYDEDEVRALMDPDGVDGGDKAMGLGGLNVAGIFRFMGSMLQPRWMTLRAYRRGHGARGISAAFGALVDFDHLYPDLARSPLADQIKLHSLLARTSGGFMLPLVAYNPVADFKTRGARLRLLTDAVENHGFIGAKIYPPVGFKPYGNDRPADGVQPADLDKTLKGFFLECSRLGIPVMSHANSTQGHDSEADGNSAPEHWRALIDELAKDQKVPLLNLGHFGGDGSDGGNEGPNDWPLRFAQAMGEDGGRGIYGDLGNWSALRDCRRTGSDCAPVRRLADAMQANPKLNERLMYGSDYFMMIGDADWKRWPEDVAAAMGPSGFDAQRLFRQNALECFGLVNGGANRARLETFFAGRLPEWLA